MIGLTPSPWIFTILVWNCIIMTPIDIFLMESGYARADAVKNICFAKVYPNFVLILCQHFSGLSRDMPPPFRDIT